MEKNLFFCCPLLLLFNFFSAQNSLITIPVGIKLPKDSVLAKSLVTCLNGFLRSADEANNKNKFVQEEDLLITSVLLDEIKEIGKEEKIGDDHFYKCCLLSVAKQDSLHFLVRISYSACGKDLPALRAVFSIVAKKERDQFYFYSPLKQNTSLWAKKTLGTTVFYSREHFDAAKTKRYFVTADDYDKKLKVKYASKTFYACSDFNEALRLIGVDYKRDYNGRSRGALGAKESNSLLAVDGVLISGDFEFDTHDLWHSRSGRVFQASVLNRPVDEGAAYLYGGSWGLSWSTILKKFTIYAKENQTADWVALYNESKNFDEKSKYPLNVDFVINALLIREIEKQKGFGSVMELISCGKKEKTNENYFSALERITGIKKSDFNNKVLSLLKE